MNKYAYCLKDNVIKIINTENGQETNITAEMVEELTNQNNFWENVKDYISHTKTTLETILSDIDKIIATKEALKS